MTACPSCGSQPTVEHRPDLGHARARCAPCGVSATPWRFPPGTQRVISDSLALLVWKIEHEYGALTADKPHDNRNIGAPFTK